MELYVVPCAPLLVDNGGFVSEAIMNHALVNKK